MGVHGLSSFIKLNPDLVQDRYQLHNTYLVIDAFNMMNEFADNSDRTDLFGGDMVKFGSRLNKILDNFEKCKITPILVMDGAQTYEASKSKVDTKLLRSRQRFNDVLKINYQGYGDSHIQPTTANMAYKSIAVDRGIKIYQSIYEADMEAVRLATEYKCPILSADSDFYLVDSPYGIIPTSTMKWFEVGKEVHKKNESDMNWRLRKPETENTESEFFISCKLYKREYFIRYLPNFDVECLPLLGPLLGNDFVSTETFSKICRSLPSNLPLEYPNPYMKQPLLCSSIQHQKIVKILCFCCDKTNSQVINQLSMNLPKDERSDFKKTIKSSMSIYKPDEDTYFAELMKIYEEGYKLTYRKRFPGPELDTQCVKAIQTFADWLIHCAEKSVMTHKVLELLNRNVIFIRPHMDDLTLPSSMNCRYRVYSVILRLLRPSTVSKKPIEVYDRVGDSYEKTLLHQLHILDEFGRINYLAYDIPTLPLDTRTDLVLATFHYNRERFDKGLIECKLWFDTKHDHEFMTIWMILDYIDTECPDAKLWKHFREATLMCFVFHYCVKQPDRNFSNHLKRLMNFQFVQFLKTSPLFKALKKIPFLGQTQLYGNRNYNCRIMHQISQLHVSIEAFNLLNSFLGSPMTRVRAECWLNSCLIYNLTEAFWKGVFPIPKIPNIIYRGMHPFSPEQTNPRPIIQQLSNHPQRESRAAGS